MSNTSKKGMPSQVESGAAQSEQPTKVVEMIVEGTPTVSMMLAKAGAFTKATKNLEKLYVKREQFTDLFFGTGENEPRELESILLIPDGAGSYSEPNCFKVSNPEMLLKFRAFVAEELSNRIEQLENEIVNFKL